MHNENETYNVLFVRGDKVVYDKRKFFGADMLRAYLGQSFEIGLNKWNDGSHVFVEVESGSTKYYKFRIDDYFTMPGETRAKYDLTYLDVNKEFTTNGVIRLSVDGERLESVFYSENEDPSFVLGMNKLDDGSHIYVEPEGGLVCRITAETGRFTLGLQA